MSSGRPKRPGRTTLGGFLERNLERLVRFTRRRRARWNKPAAVDTLDVVQEASATLLSKPLDIKSETHFVRLMEKLVRTSMSTQDKRDRARKRGGGKPLLSLSEQGESGLASAGAPDPANEACTAEELARLKQGLERLAPQDRRVIYLRIWKDQSWEAIADQLELASPAAARMHYSRARDRLRKLLGQRREREGE